MLAQLYIANASLYKLTHFPSEGKCTESPVEGEIASKLNNIILLPQRVRATQWLVVTWPNITWHHTATSQLMIVIVVALGPTSSCGTTVLRNPNMLHSWATTITAISCNFSSATLWIMQTFTSTQKSLIALNKRKSLRVWYILMANWNIRGRDLWDLDSLLFNIISCNLAIKKKRCTPDHFFCFWF